MKNYTLLLLSCAVMEMYGPGVEAQPIEAQPIYDEVVFHAATSGVQQHTAAQAANAARSANLYDTVGKSVTMQGSRPILQNQTYESTIPARSTENIYSKLTRTQLTSTKTATPSVVQKTQQTPQELQTETVTMIGDFISKFGNHGALLSQDIMGSNVARSQASARSATLLKRLDADHAAIMKNFDALLQHQDVSAANKAAIQAIKADVQNTYNDYKNEITRILNALKAHTESQAQAAADAAAAAATEAAALRADQGRTANVVTTPLPASAPVPSISTSQPTGLSVVLHPVNRSGAIVTQGEVSAELQALRERASVTHVRKAVQTQVKAAATGATVSSTNDALQLEIIKQVQGKSTPPTGPDGSNA